MIILLLLLLALLLALLIYRPPSIDPVPILVRQASRWTVASQQDESPMIALLHANYGVGYLGALQDIATDREIERVVGRGQLPAFRKKIIDAQDVATQAVSQSCPEFIGQELDPFLTKLAGDL